MADPYVPFHADWKDYPDVTTPVTAAFLEYLEAGVAEAISRAIVNAKGDLIVATAADVVARKAVGADDTALISASGQSDGMIWQKIANAQIDAAAAIAISKLASYPSDATKFLRGDGTWAAAGAAALTAALPGSPSNGDEIILVDSLSAPTYAWHLRYISAKSSNKWQFVGGSPAEAEVATAESTTSTSYAALATAGPSFTVPVAGDYLITVGSKQGKTSAGSTLASHSYDVGGTGAVDADAAVSWQVFATGIFFTVYATTKKTGVSASAAIVSKYKTGTDTMQFSNRRLIVLPIAVGG